MSWPKREDKRQQRVEGNRRTAEADSGKVGQQRCPTPWAPLLEKTPTSHFKALLPPAAPTLPAACYSMPVFKKASMITLFVFKRVNPDALFCKQKKINTYSVQGRQMLLFWSLNVPKEQSLQPCIKIKATVKKEEFSSFCNFPCDEHNHIIKPVT